MADVFVSYAREDFERVRPIVGAIEDAGYSVFWDRKIPSGMTWWQYIGKELDEAKCVVVVWSKHSVESEWVVEEANEGKERRILIPILIEDTRVPLGFRSIQHEDFREWDGDAKHRRVGSLLKSIEDITGKAPKEEPPVVAATEQPTQPPEPTPQRQTPTEQKPTQKRLTGFFFKLGPMVVSLSFAVLVLSVGLTIWFQSRKGLEPSGIGGAIAPKGVTGALAPKDAIKKQTSAVTKGEKPQEVESKTKTTEGTPADFLDKWSDLPKTFTNSLGMEFVMVPPGNFMMGSDEKPEEKPVHQVFIKKPFYMQTTEVTQGQWKEIMGENPSHFSGCGDDCPVEKVSWKEANMFIRIANERTGEQYRLPTEAEWEYAARSGGLKQTYAGGEKIDELGWFSLNSGGQTHPAGQKKPNALGIYDMSGSVSEWVEDDWHGNYNGAPTDGSAWIENPRGASRAVRGGSFGADAEYCRTSARIFQERVIRGGALGFRLAKSVDP